jgi:CRP/FNR family transcriptional regulator, cyclic AMP receptor protein
VADRPRVKFVDVIAGVPLFSGLTKRQLNSVARLCFRAEFGAGDTIVREGERDAQHMVVIVDGTARVIQKDREIATVGKGEVIGELALIDGMPRSASVVAETPVIAIVLYGTAFRKLLDEIPAIYGRLLAALSRRLRERDERSAALG